MSLESLLNTLAASGQGLLAHPAPGDITIGGALAIGAHGTGVPATGEQRPAGATYGSLSNLVVDLDAVVWDAARGAYVLRTFQRTDPQIGALLVHLGRAFVTRVRLRTTVLQKLRCRSDTTIPASELLAAPGSGGRTVASFLDQSGRMEIILFPFTKTPWLKVWTVSPSPWPPLGSRPTVLPYNDAFADLLPKPITDLVEGIQRGNVPLAPTFGATQLSIVQGGLLSSLTSDLWGSAKDLLLYVRPTTLRVTANGYAVLCRRADVRGVLHEIYTTYTTLVDRYAAGGRYPMNGPLELRVTGLDQPGDVAIPGAVEPLLSAVRRRPDRPDLDTAIWIDVLTLPGTPAAEEFYTELEQWLFGRAGAGDIDVRVEWSKGWAYTPTAGWADRETITGTIPRSLTTGQPAGADFASARATLAALDPHRIYRSPLLDLLLP